MKQKKNDKAIEFVNKALEIKKVRKAYLLKGKLYEKLNENTSALICYNKMVELNKNDLIAYQAMANNLFNRKDFVLAKKYFTICLKMIPHSIFYYKKGICEKNLGNMNEYKIDILKSLESGYEPAKKEIEKIPNFFIRKNNYLLFFDTETTGVPKNWKAPISDIQNWPRLVQLAWQLYDEKGYLKESKGVIIKPDNFIIPKEASNVHGITTEKAYVDGEDLVKVLCEFENKLKETNILIAHNMSFDEKIIGAEFYRLYKRNSQLARASCS